MTDELSIKDESARVRSLLLALIQIRDSTYRNALQLRGMAERALEADSLRPHTPSPPAGEVA